METHMENNKMLYSHVSVDCVLLGVNEDKLCVLLIERQMEQLAMRNVQASRKSDF